MQDSIVQPLVLILNQANTLLLNTVLADDQQQVVHAILAEATHLRDLVITLSELTLERVQQVFDFEARQRLTNIIGYAEMLLEEPERVSQKQARLLAEIRQAGRQLARTIMQQE
jgi:hypothetical protein